MTIAHRAPGAKEVLKCPNCGAPESSGGCRNPKQCRDARAAMERDDIEIVQSALSPSEGNATRMLLAGLEALDLLGVGLVVCNVFGQLLVANQNAEQFLASRDGLELNSERVLCAVRPCHPPVEELVQRAASAVLDREIANKDAALAVPRAANKRPLTLLIRSVTNRSKAVNSGQPAALVLILDSSVPVQAIVVELQQLYGLTSTEARLANLLMEGEALDDCCDRLGICRSTGCTHLKRIFKKTGVRRQSELVTLLLKSIGLARLGNAGVAMRSLIESSSLKKPLHKDPRGIGRASNAV